MTPNYASFRIICVGPMAAIKSLTATLVTGWRQSGAISRSGPSTNNRSESRGWGISSAASWIDWPFQSMMSISRMRAALMAAGRARPSLFSMLWPASSMAWALKEEDTAATPLTKFGCSEAGIGWLSYQGEQAWIVIPDASSREIAASQFA